jgi:putative membrane protein
MKKTRRLNFNAALKILLLLGFAAFFLITIFTGSVNLYVHPRVIPYMVFASAAMIVIAILLFQDLFRPTGGKVNSWPLLFFVIPLIMAFTLPAESFDSSSGTTGEIRLSATETFSDDSADSEQDEENPEDDDSAAGDTDAEEENEDEEDSLLRDGVMLLDSDNYYEGLCEIYTDIDKYRGTPILLEGFVFNENSSFGDNMFVPARLLMVCCAADMQTVGLLCLYDGASELEADAWVTVSGTVDKTELDGELVPCIVAESVELTEEPSETYIYPY